MIFYMLFNFVNLAKDYNTVVFQYLLFVFHVILKEKTINYSWFNLGFQSRIEKYILNKI